MRARLCFTTDLVQESLVVVLKEHVWWPHFEQSSGEALALIRDVKGTVEDSDIPMFEASNKIVVSHTPTGARGTLSLEHGVWVLRLLNSDIHLLQLACQTIVTQVVEHASRNQKKIAFSDPVQIVENKRKETIIQGQTLATQESRLAYARSQKSVEYSIAICGAIVLLALLLLTFPWTWRDFQSLPETWLFSVFEKFIGSVAVTALISYVQYRSFFRSLRGGTIRWSLPGERREQEVKAHGT